MEDKFSDEKLNPGQTHADREFSNLKAAEENATSNSINNDSSDLTNIDEVKNAESAPSSDWKNNVSSKAKSQIASKGLKNFVKKKGAIMFITGTVGIGGLGISTLFSPALLIVHMKEVMVNKFNNQLAGMEVRTKAMMRMKTQVNSTTSGVCSKITIRCKYSTMSSKQVANFEKAGIKVVGEKGLFGGRTKPTGYSFEGKSITPDKFMEYYKSDSKFRSAVHVAYNPKYAGYTDSWWKKAAKKLGLTKKKASLGNSGDSDADRMKQIQDDVKNTDKKALAKSSADSSKDTDGDGIIDKTEDKDKKPRASDAQGDIATGCSNIMQFFFSDCESDAFDDKQSQVEDEANKSTTSSDGSQKSAAKQILEEAAEDGESSIGKTMGINAVKITGAVDTACTFYMMVKAISFGAKVIRSAQLARYAMIYLNVADQIKAGTADEEDVAYLGDTLTTLTKDADGKEKSATESYGYKYSAYGDTGTMPDSTNRFMAGGGLAGTLSSVTTGINDILGGAPDATCNFLNKPWVIVGSLAIGALAWAAEITPGAPIATAANAAKLVSMASLFAVGYFLPGLLTDIVAGVVVDDTTVGEDAGDAIASGSSTIMTTAAQKGGNAPMTPNQAVEYETIKEDIAAEYAEEDRIAYSPFDTTNSNTFAGKMVAWLIPFMSKISSLSSAINSIASIVTQSFSLIAPQTTKAANAEEFTKCNDLYYSSTSQYGLGLATDPFCNVYYGISPTSLTSADPVEVADYLLEFKDPVTNSDMPLIDEESGEPKDIYEDFVKNCIDRDDPLVKSEYVSIRYEDPTGPTGRIQLDSGEIGASECIFNESTDIKTVPIIWCEDNFSSDRYGTDGKIPEAAPSPGSGYIYIRQKEPYPNGVMACTYDGITFYSQTERDYYYVGNAYFYLHYIDQRVEGGMEGEEESSSSSTTGSSGTTPPSNAEISGDGWVLKNDTDYSSAPCATGSTDTGIYKHPTQGFTIRKCQIDELGEVASIISKNVLDMKQAATAGGITLRASSAFRSYESQASLRITNGCPDVDLSPSSTCTGIPTAPAGSSLHERGIAIDFRNDNNTNTMGQSDNGFKWLQNNSTKYGLHPLYPAYQNKNEWWHWSTSGG